EAPREEQLARVGSERLEGRAGQAGRVDGAVLHRREPAVRQAAVARVEDDHPPRRGSGLRPRRALQRAQKRGGEGRASHTFEKNSSIHGVTSTARIRKASVWVRSAIRLTTVYPSCVSFCASVFTVQESIEFASRS